MTRTRQSADEEPIGIVISRGTGNVVTPAPRLLAYIWAQADELPEAEREPQPA
ncbi:MAG: hypothetical protein ACT4OZ_16250 [Gemmatimonadota bacterium]